MKTALLALALASLVSGLGIAAWYSSAAPAVIPPAAVVVPAAAISQHPLVGQPMPVTGSTGLVIFHRWTQDPNEQKLRPWPQCVPYEPNGVADPPEAVMPLDYNGDGICDAVTPPRVGMFSGVRHPSAT